MRRLALGAAAAAIVFTLASCTAVNPQAARIGDLTISQRDLEQDLTAFLADKALRAQLEQPDASGVALIPPQAKGTVISSRREGYFLSNEAEFQAIHQLAKQQGIGDVAPAADADVIAAVLPQGFEALWEHFPTGLRKRWTLGLAEQRALATSLPVPDEATQRAFFETVKDSGNGATFEQAQAQVIQLLQQKRLQDSITAVKRDMVVQIDPRYGSWDPAKGFTLPAVPLAGQQTAPDPTTTGS